MKKCTIGIVISILSRNLGYCNDTNKLSRKMGLSVISDGTGSPTVTIQDKLIKKGDQTNIEIQVKPNFVLVLLPIVFGIIGIGSIINMNEEALDLSKNEIKEPKE